MLKQFSMTLQAKLQKKAKGFGKFAPVFLEGIKFALNNQWINIEDNLPYEYTELLEDINTTVPVLTKTKWLGYFVQFMYYIETSKRWEFSEGGGVECWMPIPKLSKE